MFNILLLSTSFASFRPILKKYSSGATFLNLTCKLFASAFAFCAVSPGPKATVIRRSFSPCFLPVRFRASRFLSSSHFRRIYLILKKSIGEFRGLLGENRGKNGEFRNFSRFREILWEISGNFGDFRVILDSRAK
jgi:hypothetical protein